VLHHIVVGRAWVLQVRLLLRALPEPQVLLQVQRLLVQQAVPGPWAPPRELQEPRAQRAVPRERRRLPE